MQNLIFWLLKESQGVTLADKLILLFAKITYLGLRTILRIALGKKRRDRFFLKRSLDFEVVWYKFFKVLKGSNSSNTAVLKFKAPQYGYEFYCRNNKDDFKAMTDIGEEPILEHFNLKEGDIVIDVGAYLGRYTIIASRRVGINGKVVAIEAQPNNFEILNRNIKLNRLSNVVALNCAAYSKESKMKLYLTDEESGFSKYNTIITDRVQTTEKFVEIKATTLDSLLLQNGIKQEQVNWIKIDVEGAEYEVLKGSANVLSKSKDIALLIEIHNLRSNDDSSTSNLYGPVVEFLGKYYNFKIEFEKTYQSGEKHLVLRK